MSLNQSRSEKSESTQLRKSGRSCNYTNQQRTFSRKSSGSGGGTAHPPASLSSSRRKSKNVQGGHSRVGVSTVSSESSNANAASHGVQNGAHVLPPLHGDASRAFSLQFGSISPGFMSGMQIPARTSSAPPNSDEQKRDQAHLDSFKSVPTLPIPSVPKQQLTRKDAGAVDQSYAAEPHPMPKARNAQVSSSPASTQTQKPSVLPMTGISMQMPFDHAQVPLQFGGPNPRIQSQGMTPTSLQLPLPMPLAMGNASQVQQQAFVQGLQPHLMQPQGIMHQVQSLSFTTQMGPQMPPQLGNLGIPQLPQQQVGKFVGAPRKTVKITHPETHKEARLDERADTYFDGGSLGPRSHSNVPPQSQPIPSFTPAHPMNYYPNSYNAGSLFFPAPSSLPLTSTQITPSSEAPRFNYPVSQGPHSVTIMNPSTLSSLSVNKTGTTIPGTAEPQNLEHARDVHYVISSVLSATVHVSVKPAAGSIGDKVADSSLSISSPAVGKGESPKLSGPPMGASSFHPQRDSENFSESSLQQPKPVLEVASTSVPVASKQSRPDRRGSGMVDEEKWSKLTGPFASGRDLRLDIGYGGNVVGFRPGQRGNYGVLRNPRAQTPVHYPGGILPGLMQSMGSQGGMQRNSPDANRWQRATGFQKGLIPSPQTPLQVMHKAERKYEVGKVTDEEEAKQRQLKAILNELTPQNFEKLFLLVKAMNIDNVVTLSGVVSQIFDKALMEPTFCELYANFCFHLAGELPEFCEDNEKITFKRLLLNKCQEEFERGEREQEEANRVEEGEIKQSEEEREEKRTQALRRSLGNIRLIGELYKKRMLTERIMHECIKKLLGQYQNPNEEDVEALCELMSTIGEEIDHPRAKDYMDAYFDRMEKFSNNMKLSSRVRFVLKDAIDLRKNKWQQRRKVEE